MNTHDHDPQHALDALRDDVSARIRNGPRERARRAMHTAVTAHSYAQPSRYWQRFGVIAASAVVALLVAGLLVAHGSTPTKLSNTALASQYLKSAESDLQSAKTASNPAPLLSSAKAALAKAKPLLPQNHSDPLWSTWKKDSSEVEHEISTTEKSGSGDAQKQASSSTETPQGGSITGDGRTTSTTDDGSSGSGHDS